VLARESDVYCEATSEVLTRLGVEVERLELDELRNRYPHINFAQVAWGLFEQASGALMARRAVQTVASQTEADGTIVRLDKVEPIVGETQLDYVSTANGERISANSFVFACGHG
jgi:glycine/D-amino acid oxidase-like deaminating enzyme